MPRHRPGTTTFWVTSSHDLLQRTRDLAPPGSLLSPPEQARYAALSREVDRDDFVAARLLARLMLADAEGVPVTAAGLRQWEIRQSCAVCGEAHGRPRVSGSGLSVSWAHADGLVAVAVSPQRVGVDLERLGSVTRREPSPAHPGSLPIALAWTRGEAVVKWGYGTLDDVLDWRWEEDPAPAITGRRYRLPRTGGPRRALLAGGVRRGTVVVTDAVLRPDGTGAAVCSVAASTAARLVEPTLSGEEARPRHW
jgi:4'-phosphopantetheinyl transferase